MSDIPGQRPEPVDDEPEADLEDPETQGGQIDDGEAPGDEDREPADDEIDEPQRQPQEVGGRRARGRAFGEQLRERDQRIADSDRKIADLERTLQTLIADRQSPRQPSPAELAEQQRLERERFEMMSPYEQYQYTAQQITQRQSQQMQAMQAQLWEQGDRREFEATIRDEPRLAQYRGRVDELSKQYPGVSRDQLLSFAIGEAARTNMKQADGRRRTRTNEQRERQTARPSNGRGDIPAEQNRRGDALEERLRGQRI